MLKTLMPQAGIEEAGPAFSREAALRANLEAVRQVAAQSRLLALNAALELAGASRDAEAAEEMEVLFGTIAHAATDADQVAAAIELQLLLMQPSAHRPEQPGHCEPADGMLE